MTNEHYTQSVLKKTKRGSEKVKSANLTNISANKIKIVLKLQKKSNINLKTTESVIIAVYKTHFEVKKVKSVEKSSKNTTYIEVQTARTSSQAKIQWLIYSLNVVVRAKFKPDSAANE